MAIEIGGGYHIITRLEWGARPPNGRVGIATPTPRLWIHHTAGSERGSGGMRSIQNFHMDERGWRDIAYSFVIDNTNGAIYEGRGFGVAGGHTQGDNSTSHAICVMGNFETDVPSGAALAAIVALARYGRNHRYWVPTLGGHRDAPLANTACPGRNLYRHLPDLRLRVSDDIQEDIDMTRDELVATLLELFNEGGPLAERVQRQADQACGQAIKRQSETHGSALRTMVDEIVGRQLDQRAES